MFVNNKKFLTIGEPMAMFIANETGDLAQVEQYTRRLAGAELNVAIGMARLDFDSTYISKVGQDSFGKFIKAAVSDEGINISEIYTDKHHPTGFQLKSNQDDGEDPTVEYFRKNSAASTLSSEECDLTVLINDENSHLHLTGVAIALSESVRGLCHKAVDRAKQKGVTVSFDTNLRPTLWHNKAQMIEEVNALAIKSDWLLPGISEGKLLTGFSEPEQIADFYLQQGVKVVVIKLGEAGAYYKTHSDEAGIAAPFKVKKVVDTVGAGDSFAVGVVSALLEGCTVAEAASRGNLLGSLTVQVSGDSEGLPTREQLNRY